MSMRLTTYNDQSNTKTPGDDGSKPMGDDKSGLLASTCTECQANKHTYSMSLYHGLRSADDIRLLELFPGDKDDPLVGRIQCYALDGANDHYEALSYSWRGSRFTTGLNYEIPYHITCNGFHTSIEANLWYALRRIRLPTRPRMLWIDGIWKVELTPCIAWIESSY